MNEIEGSGTENEYKETLYFIDCMLALLKNDRL